MLRLVAVCRQVQAMAVAHLPAMQLIAGAVGFSTVEAEHRINLASGLAGAGGQGPKALGASPVLHTLLQELLQVGRQLVLYMSRLHLIAAAANNR